MIVCMIVMMYDSSQYLPAEVPGRQLGQSDSFGGCCVVHSAGPQVAVLILQVSDQLHSITFLYVISWFPYISPSTQMYSLQTWRTFVSTIGGAIVVQVVAVDAVCSSPLVLSSSPLWCKRQGRLGLSY